jgi:hypothetical protein
VEKFLEEKNGKILVKFLGSEELGWVPKKNILK